jgi:hypothetical protein
MSETMMMLLFSVFGLQEWQDCNHGFIILHSKLKLDNIIEGFQVSIMLHINTL